MACESVCCRSLASESSAPTVVVRRSGFGARVAELQAEYFADDLIPPADGGRLDEEIARGLLGRAAVTIPRSTTMLTLRQRCSTSAMMAVMAKTTNLQRLALGACPTWTMKPVAGAGR